MDDPQLGSHGHVRTGDGKIHYVVSGPRDKPLMLFLHGFPENWYTWRHQIREFQKDYRVIAMDTRGAGESQKFHSVDSYTIDKLSLDVKAVLTELGYSSCVLVGHDWGGMIALHFAGAYPDLVDKLIIMNAADITQLHHVLYTNIKQRLKSWYMFAYQIPWLPELMVGLFVKLGLMEGGYEISEENKNITSEDAAAISYGLCLPGSLAAGINYYRANISTPNPSQIRHAILCPTLLIWGTGDAYLDVCLTQGHDKYIQDFTVSFVEGANHFVNQVKPQEVNKAMREFLQGDGSDQSSNIYIS